MATTPKHTKCNCAVNVRWGMCNCSVEPKEPAIKQHDKYIVVKRSDLMEQPLWLQHAFMAMLEKFQNSNKYIVCNQDEHYAEKLWQIILDGETND